MKEPSANFFFHKNLGHADYRLQAGNRYVKCFTMFGHNDNLASSKLCVIFMNSVS